MKAMKPSDFMPKFDERRRHQSGLEVQNRLKLYFDMHNQSLKDKH